MLFGLPISHAVRCCIKMQQNEEDPALNPALDFAFAGTLSAKRDFHCS